MKEFKGINKIKALYKKGWKFEKNNVFGYVWVKRDEDGRPIAFEGGRSWRQDIQKKG